MPTRDEIYEKVSATLVEALNVDEDEVTPEATLQGDLGAESIDFLDIVFRLEREFGIKIPRGELFPESIFQGDPDFVQDGKVTDKGLENLKGLEDLQDLSLQGTAVTDATGLAKYSYAIANNAVVGTHTITASVPSDANYLAASKNATLTVNKKPVKLSVANVTGSAGTTVTLSAKLTDAANVAMPGVTLNFSVSASAVGPAATNASGIATISYAIPAGTALGTYTITVTYAGDAAYQAATKTSTLTVK